MEGVEDELKATNVVESEILTLIRQSDNTCPICRVSEKAVTGWLNGALSDLLHNEDAREKLNSGGLCRKHSETFVKVVKSNSNIGPLSAAIMLSEILKKQLTEVKGGKKQKRPGRQRIPGKRAARGCHLCRIADATESRFVTGFLVFFSELGVRRAYENSETIICFDHTRGILEATSDVSEWFVSVQKTKIGAVLDDMELLIKKHDYRSKETIGKESSSWSRAARIVGEL